MTIIDANVLIYAYDPHAPQHQAASGWLTALFNSDQTIALPWVTLWAFLRVATNPKLWVQSYPLDYTFALVADWISQPGVVILHPGPRHCEILERLVTDHRASGPMVSDAVLAALAIEHGAVLASTDQDFRRFPELRWVNPLGA